MKERRLLIVRQSENYRELVTSCRLQFRHKALHAMEAMTTWRFQLGEVGVMACQSNQPYNEVLETGIRVIGTGLPADTDPEQVLRVVADFCPTDLILQVPEPKYFRWAIRNRIRIIALFEQSFDTLTLQTRWPNYQLSKVLNHSWVNWVGNQGMSACQSVLQMGVLPGKIVPWSWPKPVNQRRFLEHQHCSALTTPSKDVRLIYQGPIVSSNGIGDLLIAMAHLLVKGRKVKLVAIGQGEIERFKAQARRLHLADQIEFFEYLSEPERLKRFHTADMLVLPSRREHSETSLSLVYDGLMTCTPIIASDHPLFSEVLRHGVNAMIFPAGNARALAHRIERLVNRPQLYTQLSDAGLRMSETCQTPLTWTDLIDRWLQSGVEDQAYLKQHSLAASVSPSSAQSSTETANGSISLVGQFA